LRIAVALIDLAVCSGQFPTGRDQHLGTASITTATNLMQKMDSAFDPNLTTATVHGATTLTLPPHSFAVVHWKLTSGCDCLGLALPRRGLV
jgi:hypothetical protein